jgi:hypothetical protein
MAILGSFKPKKNKTRVRPVPESDYLIERALARRARQRSQDASSESDSDDTSVLSDRRPSHESSASGSATAPTPPGHVLANKRSCSFDHGIDAKVTRRANAMLNRLGSSELSARATKSLEEVLQEPKAERIHRRLDRLVGRIRVDAVDFRDKLQRLANPSRTPEVHIGAWVNVDISGPVATGLR